MSTKSPPRSASPSIRDLLASTAGRSPESVAFAAPDRKPLDYRRLFALVDEGIDALNQMGIGRNDRVALVLPNGPEAASAFVTVAAAATAAPLNPAYQQSDFEFYLTDLQAKAVILAQGIAPAARKAADACGVPVIELVVEDDAEAGRFALIPPPTLGECEYGGPAGPDDVALVLHTSGTTSRPKIVPLTHSNIHASSNSISKALQLCERDCCLNVMPLFHIHGLIGAVLSSLAAGASVVCTAGFDAGQFFDWLAGLHPTWYTAVPTIHQSVLEEARRNPALAAASTLRLIRSSSSALPPQVMRELEQAFDVPVIEAYGMTEAAHQMASNPLPPAERKPGSVGLPAGPEMAIMDHDGHLLPHGVTGEIVIRGSNVTSGYDNNLEANASAFTNSWFRTGDRGRIDEDGYFYVTGRIKEMINRGGEKISPREIDEVLLQHPAIAQAVAFAVPHTSLGEDLAVAVVLRDQSTASENELRRFAFDRLADFKVPSQIVLVDAIPKGPTGKQQRIGLHEKLGDAMQREFIGPRTDLEREIVTVIEQVLQISPVGITDNFFALGGDSLKAARVLAQLSTEYEAELPAVSLFLNPTAKDLSLEITRLLSEDSESLEELLAEVEDMSDEEARRLLE